MAQAQRHHDVAGARPAGGERRHRLVPHAEVGVGHVRGHLLVARRDQLDAVARGVKRVEHADIAVAADAEHVGDFAVDQIFGDEVGALHASHAIDPLFRGVFSLPQCRSDFNNIGGGRQPRAAGKETSGRIGNGGAAARRHHARRDRPHGHQPAPGALDFGDPKSRRRGARRRHAADARPHSGRAQRRESSRRWRASTALRAGPPISARRSTIHMMKSSSTPAPRRCGRTCVERAIDKGKHIYCEKPIADCARQGDEGRAAGEREEGSRTAWCRTSCSCPACARSECCATPVSSAACSRCAASSATGCSRAWTASRRSGRAGTTRRPKAAASSSTCCATGATCSTICSARCRR